MEYNVQPVKTLSFVGFLSDYNRYNIFKKDI